MSYSWNYTLAQAVIKAVINSSASNNKTLNDVDDIDSRDKDINYPQTLEDTHKHTEYLWLLIFDLLIFLGLTFISYSSSQKLAARSNVNASNASEDFKPKFIKGLLYANGVRVVSLVFIIILENKSGNDPASWFNYLFHVVPAFVFVSAYMYLVTFLADLYYSNIEYNNHLAKPALLLIVVSSYIILALMAMITFVAQAFKSFAYSSEFLMALVYVILGTMTVYYGEKISELFAIKNNRSYDPSNDIGKKLRVLSLSIGGIFLLKGLCGLLTAFHFFADVYPVSVGANVWDFWWFLVTEISPTVVFIFVARKKENTPPKESRQSVDYEMNETPSDDNNNNKYIPPYSPNTRK